VAAQPQTFQVLAEHAGFRLDRFLALQMPEASRSRIQFWITEGRVLVNDLVVKPSLSLRGTETIRVQPMDAPALAAAQPEEIPLEVLYEDESVIAVLKPAGMVVHAGAGNYSGTLVNALLYKFGQLSQVGGALRPGIVHRLDKWTSGVLLVAKHDRAHLKLARQFASREVEKLYVAAVEGITPEKGVIEKPISRDPQQRLRMTAKLSSGRAAYTEFLRLSMDAQRKRSLLRVLIGTGRTHQIRVHLSSIGHPVVNDPLYGAKKQQEMERFLLHAFRIRFVSPATGLAVTVTAETPSEFWPSENYSLSTGESMHQLL
jgi:23S rRNA pseudouridine1911/1915/1917 synthase